MSTITHVNDLRLICIPSRAEVISLTISVKVTKFLIVVSVYVIFTIEKTGLTVKINKESVITLGRVPEQSRVPPLGACI